VGAVVGASGPPTVDAEGLAASEGAVAEDPEVAHEVSASIAARRVQVLNTPTR